jgi:hypothetical protein
MARKPTWKQIRLQWLKDIRRAHPGWTVRSVSGYRSPNIYVRTRKLNFRIFTLLRSWSEFRFVVHVIDLDYHIVCTRYVKDFESLHDLMSRCDSEGWRSSVGDFLDYRVKSTPG